MTRLTVLQSFQTLLQTQFERVYVYPDDFASSFIVEPTVPFTIVEAVPAIDNETKIYAADWIDKDWFVSIFRYVYKYGDDPPTWFTEEDVTAKTLALADLATIETLLEANTTLSGLSKPIGNDNFAFQSDIYPLAWNKQAYYGPYFLIPVTS